MGDLKYPGLEYQPSDGETRNWLMQALRRISRSQFGQPTGLLGGMAGFLMAGTPSNLDRIRWTLSLLDLQPSDRVLEVGFGPGVAIEQAAKIVSDGFVAGIDHSDAMVRQAARRNAEAVKRGRVTLARASAADPPTFDHLFDKIFTINSIHFWNDPIECLTRLRKLLRPGGVMAVTLQPRMRTATDETTVILAGEIANKLKQAGFSTCDVNIRKAFSVAAACVLAVK